MKRADFSVSPFPVAILISYFFTVTDLPELDFMKIFL